MIRDLKYKKDMELLNAMVLYNNLLKDTLFSKFIILTLALG